MAVTVCEVNESIVDFCERHSIHLGEKLGTGSSGTAYEAGWGGKVGVLKVTDEYDDASLCHFLTKFDPRDLPIALPRIWKVWRFKYNTCDTNFLIFRESLVDVPKASEEDCWRIGMAVVDTIQGSLTPAGLAGFREEFKSKLEEYEPRTSDDRVESWLLEWKELALWLYQRQIQIRSARIVNLGMRGDHLVFRDIGNNSFEPEFHQPPLTKVRRPKRIPSLS